MSHEHQLPLGSNDEGAYESSRKDTVGSDSEDRDDEEDYDVHKMLQDIKIPDFSLIDFTNKEDPHHNKNNNDGCNCSSDDCSQLIEREEIFSKRYHPSTSERGELCGLSARLGVSSSSIRLSTCSNTLHDLLFGNHSIVLKKISVSFNKYSCELFLLTDGFIAMYRDINVYNPLESRYHASHFWWDIEFVNCLKSDGVEFRMKSGESYNIVREPNGGDMATSWIQAIEHSIILNTIHKLESSTITDVLGWQYKLIHRAGYTAVITNDMQLMGNPTDLNTLDDYNQCSPLHYALQSEDCHPEIVEALLRMNADPNLIDGEGRSAMYYAQRNELLDIEKILKDNGGRPSQLAEIEARGELFGGVHQATKNSEKRREIEQIVKGNKAAEAAGKAQSTQSQMSQNMAAMIERGETIDDIDDKARQLKEEAKNYGKLASQLKHQMKNKKWYQF